ncbi:hypothetical protein [Tenacibaculum xiamenense]|uniref:hypothetical protein n=1 Tax=Tenacibaculum xiamenense TaxID=1261553 RepID=UPI0038961C96
MKINQIFTLIFTFVVLTNCGDDNKELKFQEKDKEKIVLQRDILSEKYLKTVEFKNHLYSKFFDTISGKMTYEYESELWKNDKIIGGFIVSTFIYPKSDLNKMDEHFFNYLAGFNFGEFISSGIRYQRTHKIELPFREYRIYETYKNDTLNMGLSFNVLKKNKIIFASVVTHDPFELEIKKLIDKLNKI